MEVTSSVVSMPEWVMEWNGGYLTFVLIIGCILFPYWLTYVISMPKWVMEWNGMGVVNLVVEYNPFLKLQTSFPQKWRSQLMKALRTCKVTVHPSTSPPLCDSNHNLLALHT